MSRRSRWGHLVWIGGSLPLAGMGAADLWSGQLTAIGWFPINIKAGHGADSYDDDSYDSPILKAPRPAHYMKSR